MTNPFTWLAWALFGNDDDGIYGDLNWNPTQEKTWQRAVLWWLRNPFHNALFFVLGTGHTDSTRAGKYPADVFSPVGGWNYAVTTVKRYSRVLSGLIVTVYFALVWSLSIASYKLLWPSDGWHLSWDDWYILAARGVLLLPLAAFTLYSTAAGFRIYGFMPFVSYIGAIKFYVGWRERGNFGVKLTRGPGAR
jgi:hypothetical protein